MNENENKTMYLVTGAAGFLGGTIARQLVKKGEKVRAFVLPNDPALKFVPKEAEIVEGDLTDKESLERFFTVPDGMETIVLHIASIVSVNPEYSQRVMDVNVEGTKNVIDCCLAHPECKKMVYCSSTGAIPELPKAQKISEVDYFDETKVLGCYSMSKALASQEVLDAVHHLGLNACIIHPSGIMGPEDFACGETTSTLIKIINGEMPAGIDGSFNLCDVRDLAAGAIAAAEKGRCGECYILANEPVTFRDFAKMIAAESGCKRISMFLPIWAANLMGAAMEAQAKHSHKKPLMTTFSVYNLARNNSFDSSKAEQELGYKTRSYRETIHDEVQWLIENGLIPNHNAVSKHLDSETKPSSAAMPA